MCVNCAGFVATIQPYPIYVIVMYASAYIATNLTALCIGMNLQYRRFLKASHYVLEDIGERHSQTSDSEVSCPNVLDTYW